MPQNLTGIADNIWGGMNMGGAQLNQLSEEEQLQRKKKLMAAGQSTDMQSAMSYLFQNRLNSAGNPRA